MSLTLSEIALALALLLGILGLLEAGRRLGAARRARFGEGAHAGLGAIENAVFALLGLLIAFTFSGAADRFDARRRLVGEEANEIGTTWLRIGLLPADAQPALRDLFRRYLDARIETYRWRGEGENPAMQSRYRSLQNEIWAQAVAACRTSRDPPALLFLSALNSMIDITTTRLVATWTHPPAVIFAMLVALALFAAVLVGYAAAAGPARSWIHLLGFALVIDSVVFVIVDIEYPRAGLLRIDAVDQVLVDLRKSMN